MSNNGGFLLVYERQLKKTMSAFTSKEIEYISKQPLGRLATINPEGKPQIAPVGFRYNPDLDAIEIGGLDETRTKKYSNIQKNPNVAFVIDDVLPPWRPRGVEIRGTAQALATGGKAAFGSRYEAGEAMIRIIPDQIISWGFEEGQTKPLSRKVNR